MTKVTKTILNLIKKERIYYVVLNQHWYRQLNVDNKKTIFRYGETNNTTVYFYTMIRDAYKAS